MKAKETTIYDIADRLNISPSTVSRGLKAHHTVSVKTRKKILAVAEELGYQTNPLAAGLSTKKTNTIGVIIPRVNSDFMASVLSGIENACTRSGFTLIITQSQESKEKEIANATTMLRQRVDGLLVSLSADGEDLKHFEAFTKKHIPVLFFDRCPEQSTYPSVLIDNKEAGYQVTSYLISKGAKTIVHISADQGIRAYRERFEGYLMALKEHGIRFREEWLIRRSLTEDSAKELARKVIDLQADGVFAANDVAAASCMNELRKAGLNVPRDIQIAGFNNDISSRIAYPSLTTVNNPGQQIGEVAAQNLINHLHKRSDLSITSSIILKSELIVRDSTL